ncbi:MAG TPA: HAD family hydrolase [Chloroflexota bacterium]
MMAVRESAETFREAVPDIVFMLDVDNTLLDNDALKADLADRLRQLLGENAAERFWEIYEQVRQDEDVVDYPETVKRFVDERGDGGLRSSLVQILDTIPFSSYLYPHAIETIEYLKTIGVPVIVSDGDPVFQPLKILRSGLEAAVDGRVLIYVHKEEHLPDVFRRYPARHYVAIDDKPRILSLLESCCPSTFTTVLVLQGHYGVEGEHTPPPDMVIQRIGDLRNVSKDQFLRDSAHPAAAT